MVLHQLLGYHSSIARIPLFCHCHRWSGHYKSGHYKSCRMESCKGMEPAAKGPSDLAREHSLNLRPPHHILQSDTLSRLSRKCCKSWSLNHKLTRYCLVTTGNSCHVTPPTVHSNPAFSAFYSAHNGCGQCH